MTQVEKRWPESSYFLLFTEACGTSREAGSCLHETVSAVRWLGISPMSETHGFRATRRSLAALPLKVESSFFRANVSLRVAYGEARVWLWRERLAPTPTLALALTQTLTLG